MAIFALIAAITALSVYAIEAGERERKLAELRREAQTIASAVERRGDAASAYLQAGAALFAAKGDISRAEFGGFVDSLRLDSDYFGSEGIGWAKVIAPLQVPAFEAELGVAGARQVFPKPLVGARMVVPVTYLHPGTERNRRALGYDMYSEAVRREAMNEAVRSVEPTTTTRLVLLQEGNSKAAGFIVYMPVYDGAGGGRALRGFIYSPFNAAAFLESAVRLSADYHHTIRLYDGEAGDDNLLASLGRNVSKGITVTEQVNFANRAMLLEMEASHGETFSPLSLVTLIFGLLVASLLLVVVRLMTRQLIEDRAALDWLEEQDQIRNALSRELNHRVKNALANVLSIISLTRRRADGLDDFADRLDGRVRAMSATHDLLTQSEWGTIALRDVLEAELAAYLAQKECTIELAGPPVQLAPGDALTLGLAAHELATNAARHGALSVAGGVVSIVWEAQSGNAVRVVWQESGGPKVEPAGQQGFGLQLLERIVARDLGQPVDIVFDPAGLRSTMVLPVRPASDFALRARQR